MIPVLAFVLAGCPEAEQSQSESTPAAPTSPGPGAGGGVGSIGGQGGATAASGAAGDAAGGASAGTTTPFDPHGSFDVVLGSVTATIAMGPAQVMPPSLGARLRIDVPPQPKGPWKATVTPRWGQPSSFDVAMSEDGLLLSNGSASIGGKQVGAADVWQTFTIALDPSGHAIGRISGVGQENVYSGSIGYTGSVSASGSIAPDATPPEAKRIDVPGFGPSDVLLPWEPFRVAFSEPVVASTAQVSVVDQSGQALDASFRGEPAGAPMPVSLRGVFGSWGDGQIAPELHLGDGYADPVGNTGTGFTAPFQVLFVPSADGLVQTFQSDAEWAKWGAAVHLTGADAAASCETSDCVMMGPFDNDVCGVEPTGIAGRLVGTPYTKEVHLRVRVLYKATDTGAPATTGFAPLSLQLARPGHAPTTVDVSTTQLPEPIDLGPSAGDFRWATKWGDVQFMLPEGSGEIGFAIHAAAGDAIGACAAGMGGMPVSTEVFVESIVVQ